MLAKPRNHPKTLNQTILNPDENPDPLVKPRKRSPTLNKKHKTLEIDALHNPKTLTLKFETLKPGPKPYRNSRFQGQPWHIRVLALFQRHPDRAMRGRWALAFRVPYCAFIFPPRQKAQTERPNSSYHVIMVTLGLNRDLQGLRAGFACLKRYSLFGFLGNWVLWVCRFSVQW